MLEGLKPVKEPAKCKMAVWMQTLDKADVALMESYLADDDFPTQTMSRRLLERGVQIGSHVIANHRRKECSCYRVG